MGRPALNTGMGGASQLCCMGLECTSCLFCVKALIDNPKIEYDAVSGSFSYKVCSCVGCVVGGRWAVCVPACSQCWASGAGQSLASC